MKSCFIVLSVFSCLLIYPDTCLARHWSEFIKVETTASNNHGKYVNPSNSPWAKQTPFRNLLKQWQQNKEQDIKNLTDSGVDVSFAKKAVEERIALSTKLVDSNFQSPMNVSPLYDRAENRAAIVKRVATLGVQRLKSLAEKEGVGLSQGFMNCLCSFHSVAGTGIGYHPEKTKDCPTTDPCKGGNWGCVHKDLPKVAAHWASCAKIHKSTDGANVFQQLENTLSKNLGSRERLQKLFNHNETYRKACLPTLPHEIINDILEGNSVSIIHNALEVADKTSDICDEAIRVSLYTSGEQGLSEPEIELRLLAPWVLPDAIGTAEGLVGALPILSSANNLYSNLQLLDQELGKHRMNVAYRDAYKLYQESEKWTLAQQDMYERAIDRDIKKIDDKEDSINKELMHNVYSAQPSMDTIKVIGPPFNHLGMANNAPLWKKFFNKRNALIKEANRQKGALVLQRTKMLLKRNVISNYRKPLTAKGCKQFLADRQIACQDKAESRRILETATSISNAGELRQAP